MYELITTLILFALIVLLIRHVLWGFIPLRYITWIGFGVILVMLAVIFFEPDNRAAGIVWAILSFPFRPLGLTIILLGFALSHTFLWLGKKPVSYAVPQLTAAFLILFITSLPLTAYLLTAQTEQRIALEISRPPSSTIEAIVVLGDGTLPADPAYRIRTQLSNPVNGLGVAIESRLDYAVQLYNVQASQGKSPKIFVSLGPQSVLGQPGVTPTDAITVYLVDRGIPIDDICVDTEGFDPRSSAIAARKFLLGPEAVQDCKLFVVCESGWFTPPPPNPAVTQLLPVIVVTPAMMVRRVISTFTNLYFDVTPRSTDFYVFQIQGGLRIAAITDLIPNAEALTITTRVIDEYWAWIYYFLRGWLIQPLGL